MAKAKYAVNQYLGVPVEADASGHYQIKREPDGDFKLHSWRTGRHSKGKYRGAGQIFLTENNLKVAIVAAYPVAYKDRHGYTPMQRLTSEFIDDAVLRVAQERLPQAK
ncbi:hypothetical protein LZY01_23580 [Levilactobacillus zymae]|uniref:DUF7671 domain-containing protein n=1 Tax=Levilactobacillus zymae TaxID=267363 RepID=A0ABQ0WZY8_9LACO|nr:hypothetical protein [Levilactobacillus zymae]KRL16376.1 hypothetical protein FD38_GL002420 [Levilactobacillus zymae DSM 19395]QFR62377.1 hypothetical protein LZ395_12845 [Levilactobacillus zymae]GEO73190.1 hypothetical protein LZY01_23580 [Levilactobacillus zymae]